MSVAPGSARVHERPPRDAMNETDDWIPRHTAEIPALRPATNSGAFARSGVITCDEHGSITSADSTWREMVGYHGPFPLAPDEFARLTAVDPDGPMMSAWGEAVATGTEFTWERPMRLADGSTRFARFHALPVPSANGEKSIFVGTLTDLTDQIDADVDLRTREQGLQDIIEALHEAVLITGPTGIEAANTTLREMFDLPSGPIDPDVLFESVGALDADGNPLTPDDRASVVVARTGQPVMDMLVRAKTNDGSDRWLSITAVPRIIDEEVIGAIATFRDVTESKLAADTLAANEKLHRTLTESMPIGIFQSGRDGTLTYVNPAWSTITGSSRQDAIGTRMTDRIHPADVDMVLMVFKTIATTGEPNNCQYRFLRVDGDTIWARVHAAPLRDPDSGAVSGFIGSIENITPVMSTRNELSRLAQIIERTSDLVGTIDPETFDVTYLNRSARLLLGLSRDEARHLHATDLYTPEAIETFFDIVLPRLETYGSWTGDLAIKGPDDTVMQLTQTITLQRNPDGSIREYSAIGRDTTEQQRMAAELEFRATHDALTSLPNRTLLLDRISQALARAERGTGLIAVIFLDIDRFKIINDTFGHSLGDRFLIEVAEQITESLRPSDTVARLGGDEFVVLLEEVRDEVHALTIARRVADAIGSHRFDLDGSNLTTTVSGGIALSAGGHGEHADAILRDSDAAMYRAKDRGRSRLELFDETMRRRASERIELVDELAEAIASDQIHVFYQPVVDLLTGSIVGAEALARWIHPERGIISPAEFIPAAEESGLIVDLGLHVLETACRQAAEWNAGALTGNLQVHVNLSTRQLNSAELPTQVADILNSTGLARSSLCLEITESSLMEDANRATALLDELKRIGVSLAIDDFGTGYSSLAYLMRFPIDTLKIDRSFVDGLGPDAEDPIIVQAIINLASTLALDVVAEGVETDVQLDFLKDLGCGKAQGYLFAKPAPADEITTMLASAP